MQAFACVWGVQHAPPWQTIPVAQVSGHATVPPHPFGAVPHATPVHAVPWLAGVQHVPLSQV